MNASSTSNARSNHVFIKILLYNNISTPPIVQSEEFRNRKSIKTYYNIFWKKRNKNVHKDGKTTIYIIYIQKKKHVDSKPAECFAGEKKIVIIIMIMTAAGEGSVKSCRAGRARSRANVLQDVYTDK